MGFAMTRVANFLRVAPAGAAQEAPVSVRPARQRGLRPVLPAANRLVVVAAPVATVVAAAAAVTAPVTATTMTAPAAVAAAGAVPRLSRPHTREANRCQSPSQEAEDAAAGDSVVRILGQSFKFLKFRRLFPPVQSLAPRWRR
jgi:hypothetical protein